ncbi:hypothetical protein BIW11_07596 [Tropilaelaps mercedesae]|uniref:Uncharacterized protein n=1 Tax=Tropilaelaps mercedesae TaxID=418985 RepID=A0A1V9XTA0_9ACAR|nr:hypothetical protein BIW11_07596 [Tropilaelaps mercedesae]
MQSQLASRAIPTTTTTITKNGYILVSTYDNTKLFAGRQQFFGANIFVSGLLVSRPNTNQTFIS